ncbi:MAG: hypothetical protein IPN68_09975 [Bacteroidetes bacterium]|nr:hypothetical protein [Bacteroidota bacterium]
MKIKTVYDHWLPRYLGVDGIVVYPFILFKWKTVPEAMLRHEWKHVEQVQKHGVFKFYISYLLYYLANRLAGHSHFQAYWKIPWEIEARDAEEK